MPPTTPMAYFGGKTRLAARIVRALAPHEHYVEPFAGSLAVLLAKPRSRMETVNDLDGDLMTFWKVLRDRPADLARVCALTPHSRAEHKLAQSVTDHSALDDLERARLVWVRINQSRAGLLKRAGWRHYVDPGVSVTGMPGYLDSYVDRMAAAAERLHHVSLECRPALEVIATYGQHRRVCLYVDPPYLGTTRSSGDYQVDMHRADQHAELLEALNNCRASVVLSGYHSPLYDSLLSGWDRIEIATATGQGGNDARTEVIWANRQLPQPDQAATLPFGDEWDQPRVSGRRSPPDRGSEQRA